MAAAKQLKRVSWAPDLRLRQVRLFLSEDAPSQSRLGAQDHLQAKGSWLQHSAGIGSDDSLPPGFEVPQPTYQFNLSQIPLIKWQCPPRFGLNAEWLVVAGEESEEVALQDQRLLGVLEAIYPRPSDIPLNPSVSSEIEDFCYDDSLIPSIPLTAVEDEDTKDQSDTAAPIETPHRFQQRVVPSSNNLAEVRSSPALSSLKFTLEKPENKLLPPSVLENPSCRSVTYGAALVAEPDVAAAASAAFTAMMRSSEEDSLIDRDLLIKIFSNPTLIEKLVSESGTTSRQTPPGVATTSPPSLPPHMNSTSLPPPPPLPHMNPPASLSLPTLMSHINPSTSLPRPASHLYQANNAVGPVLHLQPPVVAPFPAANPSPGGSTMKDRNYYKNLIQLHGGDWQEHPDPNPVLLGNHHTQPSNFVGLNGVEGVNNNEMRRDQKPKIRKPCAYFNTPRGCRNGASCLYQHDGSFPQRIELPKSSKRIKLDRGIAGRI